MQQVVKVMVKPLIATLAEQGMTLKFQPSALKLLATKGYDPEMGSSPTASCLADRSGRSTSRAIAERPSPRRANHQGWNDSRNDQVWDCLGGCHDASAINPYFALAALCVALRQAFAPFPNVQPISAIFFSWWYLKGIALLFLWWWSPCLSPPFSWDEPDCVLFRLSPLAVWCSFGASVTSGCPFVLQIPFVGLLSFAYGVLIDTVYALIYHIPWWTYALVNGFSFNLAHALSTIIFYPIIYQIFRRFYVEKPFLAWWPYFAALLLASCAPSHSTNNQTSFF